MDDRLEEVLKLQEEVIKGITRSSSSLRGIYDDFWGANSPFAKPQKSGQAAPKERPRRARLKKPLPKRPSRKSRPKKSKT